MGTAVILWGLFTACVYGGCSYLAALPDVKPYVDTVDGYVKTYVDPYRDAEAFPYHEEDLS